MYTTASASAAAVRALGALALCAVFVLLVAAPPRAVEAVRLHRLLRAGTGGSAHSQGVLSAAAAAAAAGDALNAQLVVAELVDADVLHAAAGVADASPNGDANEAVWSEADAEEEQHQPLLSASGAADADADADARDAARFAATDVLAAAGLGTDADADADAESDADANTDAEFEAGDGGDGGDKKQVVTKVTTHTQDQVTVLFKVGSETPKLCWKSVSGSATFDDDFLNACVWKYLESDGKLSFEAIKNVGPNLKFTIADDFDKGASVSPPDVNGKIVKSTIIAIKPVVIVSVKLKGSNKLPVVCHLSHGSGTKAEYSDKQVNECAVLLLGNNHREYGTTDVVLIDPNIKLQKNKDIVKSVTLYFPEYVTVFVAFEGHKEKVICETAIDEPIAFNDQLTKKCFAKYVNKFMSSAAKFIDPYGIKVSDAVADPKPEGKKLIVSTVLTFKSPVIITGVYEDQNVNLYTKVITFARPNKLKFTADFVAQSLKLLEGGNRLPQQHTVNLNDVKPHLDLPTANEAFTKSVTLVIMLPFEVTMAVKGRSDEPRSCGKYMVSAKLQIDNDFVTRCAHAIFKESVCQDVKFTTADIDECPKGELASDTKLVIAPPAVVAVKKREQTGEVVGDAMPCACFPHSGGVTWDDNSHYKKCGEILFDSKEREEFEFVKADAKIVSGGSLPTHGSSLTADIVFSLLRPLSVAVYVYDGKRDPATVTAFLRTASVSGQTFNKPWLLLVNAAIKQRFVKWPNTKSGLAPMPPGKSVAVVGRRTTALELAKGSGGKHDELAWDNTAFNVDDVIELEYFPVAMQSDVFGEVKGAYTGERKSKGDYYPEVNEMVNERLDTGGSGEVFYLNCGSGRFVKNTKFEAQTNNLVPARTYAWDALMAAANANSYSAMTVAGLWNSLAPNGLTINSAPRKLKRELEKAHGPAFTNNGYGVVVLTVQFTGAFGAGAEAISKDIAWTCEADNLPSYRKTGKEKEQKPTWSGAGMHVEQRCLEYLRRFVNEIEQTVKGVKRRVTHIKSRWVNDWLPDAEIINNCQWALQYVQRSALDGYFRDAQYRDPIRKAVYVLNEKDFMKSVQTADNARAQLVATLNQSKQKAAVIDFADPIITYVYDDGGVAGKQQRRNYACAGTKRRKYFDTNDSGNDWCEIVADANDEKEANKWWKNLKNLKTTNSAYDNVDGFVHTWVQAT